MTKRIANERSPGGILRMNRETSDRQRTEEEIRRSVTVECENPERACAREQRALRVNEQSGGVNKDEEGLPKAQRAI